MKHFILTAALVCTSILAFAQSRPQSPIVDLKPEFSVVKAAPITSIKNQASSGTCWSYSTVSFLESEAIRINKLKEENYPDFSPFFVVAHSYSDRAMKYVLLDGHLTFAAGSEADDVLHVVKDYGIVPWDEMTGMNYGTPLPKQAEMDAVLHAYIEAVAKNPNRTLSTAWKRGFDAIVAEYCGEYPESFEVNGKSYTPESYRDAMGIKAENYVTLTSFTHHPFYEEFALEVCDNWRWDLMWNVPIDEFIAVLDHALENGYTAAWGTDVSHIGFTRNGLGILLDADATKAQAAGSDQAHWVGEGPAAKAKTISLNDVVESETSQEIRQEQFENKTVTDDHGMHIFGIAKDENGKKYYMVKNSWGLSGNWDGIWYVTEAFVRNQSMDIMVHKEALPKDIAKKLGIK